MTEHTALFAFLVGINVYRCPEANLLGCCLDVDRYRRYLVGDLLVPDNNIRILQNEEATRDAILRTFEEFLINNSRIRTGDALIFHFSGHGSRKPAPEGWLWGNGNEESPLHEVIIPYDAVVDFDRDIPAFCAESGIPNRTLASLLRKASARHGDNITVTLDCCHSGSATRVRNGAEKMSEFRPRGLDPQYVGDLTADTDKHIWHDDCGDADADAVLQSSAVPVTASRSAKKRGERSSHVLMAACDREQEVNDSIAGGWFTNAWLSALRDSGIQPPTYAKLHVSVTKQLNDMYLRYVKKKYYAGEQTPQCEGVHRDRHVFGTVRLNFLELSVSAVQNLPGWCSIEAGLLRGITPGTIFDLRRHGSDIYTGEVLGVVIADTVDVRSSTAMLPSDWKGEIQDVRAFVRSLSRPLKFSIVHMEPYSSASTKNFELVRGCFTPSKLRAAKTPSGSMLVRQDEGPDLCLLVHEQGISFSRQDELMTTLQVNPDSVDASDIERVFPSVMGYLSRFNRLLAQTNPAHPFADPVVTLALHTLKELAFGKDNLHEVDQVIPFTNNFEATVHHTTDICYGVVLKNYSCTPLFVYVFWYDPTAYSIEIFYEPLNTSRNNAPLAAAVDGRPGMLQIGGSPECIDGMTFEAPGFKLEQVFMKIILSAEAVPVQFMEQTAALGTLIDGNNSPKRGSPEAHFALDQWDVLLRLITILPENE